MLGSRGAMPETVDGLPNLCGSETLVAQGLVERGAGAPRVEDRGSVRAAFGVALHMHQPLIPAGGGELRSARVVSNLRFMMEHPEEKDAHNAPVFLECYARMGDMIRELVAEGGRPRVMLDYSGCLLHGLLEMGAGGVIERLRPLANEPALAACVEWLGTAWGHAVAPSTPVQDFRRHVMAWRHHFAAIFGVETLARVRGFSPPEMALPNHPDVCFEFVRTLLECGYEWVMVQEHTVESADGGAVARPHVPHRLVARNSRGEEASIVALIKTQGSDTKLVGQMQPYYEAKGLQPVELGGRRVPQMVTQIADGENGGVMMNEFPPMFMRVMREAAGSGAAAGDVAPMNGSEYLAHLAAAGVRDEDYPVVRPVFQKRVWDRMGGRTGAEALAGVIAELKREDGRFHMEGGSWTADLSWVRGYESVLGPMESASAAFAERVEGAGIGADDPRYRAALFHLLAGQTSCFRYWGEGTWTEYGRELCRRVVEGA